MLAQWEYLRNSFIQDKQKYMINVVVCIIIVLICYRIRIVILPPRNFPKNIPSIPFYVTFLGAVTNLDQEEIFKKYFQKKLETHGAVKLYFASRWSILVTSPTFLLEIFKNQEIYEKRGNHFKSPHSVLAEYTGDNVISAGNENWKLYRKFVTNSILFPDLEPLQRNTQTLVDNFRRFADGRSHLVADTLEKYTLGCLGDCIVGVDLHTDGNEKNKKFYSDLKYLESQIFKPLVLTFPFLDRLPIPSRMRTRKAVREYKTRYCERIEEEMCIENSSRLGPSLHRAMESGELTKKQFQDNATIVMIAGHENPLFQLASALYMLAKNPEIQRRLKAALRNNSSELKSKEPYLNAFIFETIRYYPALGQVINKMTTRSVKLGGYINIPKGTYVGYNNYGTQRDPHFWGDDADDFNPERWGTTYPEILKNFNTSKSRCTLPAFHGRSRACIGEKFGLAELKLAIIGIMENFEILLDPEWIPKITPAGPISPFKLRIKIFEDNKGVVSKSPERFDKHI